MPGHGCVILAGVAVALIAFPFRIGPTGSLATVEQNSDTEVDQLLAVALLTAPGERDQVPTFGVADPAFSGFPRGALQRHVIDFGPQVEITEVLINPTMDGREEVVVHWVRPGLGEGVLV